MRTLIQILMVAVVGAGSAFASDAGRFPDSPPQVCIPKVYNEDGSAFGKGCIWIPVQSKFKIEELDQNAEVIGRSVVALAVLLNQWNADISVGRLVKELAVDLDLNGVNAAVTIPATRLLKLSIELRNPRLFRESVSIVNEINPEIVREIVRDVELPRSFEGLHGYTTIVDRFDSGANISEFRNERMFGDMEADGMGELSDAYGSYRDSDPIGWSIYGGVLEGREGVGERGFESEFNSAREMISRRMGRYSIESQDSKCYRRFVGATMSDFATGAGVGWDIDAASIKKESDTF